MNNYSLPPTQKMPFMRAPVISLPSNNGTTIRQFPAWHGIEVSKKDGFVALAGIRVHRILHWELLREKALPSAPDAGIPALCHAQWIALATAIAVSPEPIEFLMILGSLLPTDGNAKVSMTFWVIGRGLTSMSARASCRNAFQNLWLLLTSNLEFIEFQSIANTPENKPQIQALRSYLQIPHVIELRRRYESVPVSHSDTPASNPATFGFQISDVQSASPENQDNTNHNLHVRHLFPWMPNFDSWERLLEMFSHGTESKSLIVHFQSLAQVPDAVLEEAYLNLADAEKVLDAQAKQQWEANTILTSQATVLRDLCLQRLSFLKGSVLAARTFIATLQPPTSATQATIISSIDSRFAPTYQGQEKTQMLFRGGVSAIASTKSEILAPFDSPSLDVLFAPEEANVILRTPMPINGDLPGIPSVRSRTAAMTGTSGNDCLLGANVHRDSSKPVYLDDALRFRHAYIIGQTGTGKSTLMQQMILHDINEGRGVAVLDPHGTLIEDILECFPAHRADDLVLVDVTDVERPIGFNIMCIPETDPFQYRLDRDVLIDDIYAYLDRTYGLKETGGPIFESHFRSSMALLLGSSAQHEPYIPNLMIFRALYTNENLRDFLVAMEDDPITIEFVKEAGRAGGDASLENIAPYITSKFNRFITNTALRNITCQNRILDIDAIVNEGKVLLFYLGKAKFGAQAAGLLSSQIVSRICNAAMKRGTEGKPFYLYADEFQLFADERFAEILAEARKFKLSLTVAHQYIQQLPRQVLSAVLGNVGTTIALRVGAVDGEVLEPLFAPTFGRGDLTSATNFFAYVKSSGTLGQTPFSMELLPPSKNRNPSLAAELRQMSRMKYGRSRREVEQEIAQTYKAYTALAF